MAGSMHRWLFGSQHEHRILHVKRAIVAAVVTMVVVFGVAVVWSSHRDRIRVSGTVTETATFGGANMCAGLDYGRENLVFTEPGGTTTQGLEVPLSDETLVSNEPLHLAPLVRSRTWAEFDLHALHRVATSAPQKNARSEAMRCFRSTSKDQRSRRRSSLTDAST